MPITLASCEDELRACPSHLPAVPGGVWRPSCDSPWLCDGAVVSLALDTTVVKWGYCIWQDRVKSAEVPAQWLVRPGRCSVLCGPRLHLALCASPSSHHAMLSSPSLGHMSASLGSPWKATVAAIQRCPFEMISVILWRDPLSLLSFKDQLPHLQKALAC